MMDKETALERLDKMRQQYEKGDRAKLISAIRHCGRNKIVMPDWVANEFIKKTDRWVNYGVEELGQALGVTWPTGAHLEAHKKKQRLKFKIYNEVMDQNLMNNQAINTKLFLKVGKKFHIGSTLAKDYYYEVQKILDPEDGSGLDFHKK